MQRRILLISLLLGAQLCAAQAAPKPANAADPEVEARIERITNGLLPQIRVTNRPPITMTLAARMKNFNVPGVSIAVIHEGKIEWARGFGVTQIDGPPVTPDTLFQAGSISKPVASMGALKLVEQGKLKLDEDVNQTLTSWKLPENEFTKTKKVTLRALMTHSAGLTVHGFPGYAAGEPVPTVPQVLDGAKPQVNTEAVRVHMEPGSKWEYSGGGITIMQLMMTDVAKKPFPTLMRELVLGPLGMTASTYEEPLPEAKRAVAATPYYPQLRAVPGGPHTYPEMAAAGLWTTASDLARWAIAVQEGVSGKRNPVLSQASLQQMTRKQFEGWGLGVGVNAEGEKATFSHGGVDEGFDAQLFAYTNKGEGVAVMTNANGGQNLTIEIMRAIAKEYGWPDFQQEERSAVDVDASSLERFAGTYEVPNFATPPVMRRFEVTVHDGKMFLRIAGPETEMYAATPTRFFGPFQGNWYEFVPGEGGTIELKVIAGGREVKGKRVQ